MRVHSDDVIVIGAGIIGASIAWRIAQRGPSVVLVDAGRMGAEASSAGAGMLAPGGEIEREDDFARLLVRSLSLYPNFVSELEKESGVEIDFSVCGAIESVGSEQEMVELRRRAAMQRRMGIDSEQISPTEMFYPRDAIVNSEDVMNALRTALTARSNVRIAEQCRVDRVAVGTRGVTVEGMEARVAVLAAGAWSSQIAVDGVTLPRSYPVKGHLLGYELEPGTLATIRRSGHTYILQRSTGFTIVGSSQEDEGFDKTVHPEIAARIRERGERLLPKLLCGRAPNRVWTGLRPGAERPAIGRADGSPVWLAYGHFRNGILAAPATADQICDEVMATV